MLSKNKINSLKKKPQFIYFIEFKQSGILEFRFKKEEKLYREDGTLALNNTRYEYYIPDLSISKYTIYSGDAKGILYKEEDIFVFFEEDNDYNLKYIEKCFDGRNLAIEEFVKKEKGYVVLANEYLYTISEYNSENTKEKIEEFIKTLNENGFEAKLIKGE